MQYLADLFNMILEGIIKGKKTSRAFKIICLLAFGILAAWLLLHEDRENAAFWCLMILVTAVAAALLAVILRLIIRKSK